MNIVIVPSWYRNKAQPNSGSFFRDQAKALAKDGHNVVILDPSLRVRKGWFEDDCMKYIKSKDENLTIYSYNFPSLFFGRFPKLYAFVFRWVLKFLINKMLKDGFKPDIYHAHSVYAAGYALSKIKKINSPLIITEHSSALNNKVINNQMKFMLNKSINKSSTFISVSDNLTNNIKINLTNKVSLKKITTIPNMIDDIFQYQKPNIKEDFVFISVGNLVENKQMELLITSFHATFKSIKNVKLRIVGTGYLYKKLQKLIQELGMSDQILLLGEKNKKELYSEYSLSHAFVLLSKKETFGVAYREAMAVGRPIISTFNGGIDSDVNDFNGIFVNCCEKNEIQNGLEEMYYNYEKFNSSLISKKCIEKYSSKSIVQKITEIYTTSLLNFNEEK